jgi:hypothetical protein
MRAGLDGAPAELAKSPHPLFGLAADSTYAYFVFSMILTSPAERQLTRVPRAGGAPTSLYAPGAGGYVGSVMIAQDTLFVTERSLEGDRILRIPAAGGAPTPLLSRGRDRTLSGVIVSGDHVYWIEHELLVEGKTFHPVVWRMNLDGSSPEEAFKLPDDTTVATYAVVGDTLVYHEVGLLPLKSDLWRMPRNASPTRVGTAAISTFAAIGDSVLFGTAEGIQRLNPATGDVTPAIASEAREVTAIAAHAGQLYWAESRCLYKKTL